MFRLFVVVAILLASPAQLVALGHENQDHRLSPHLLEILDGAQGRPFLINGSDVEETRGNQQGQNVNAYISSLRRFPSFSDCLTQEGSFAWNSLRSTQDVEVCIGQVSDALGDVVLIEQFMADIGFTSVISWDRSAHLMKNVGSKCSGTAISASVRKESYPFRRRVGWRWPFDLSYSVSIGQILDCNGRLLRTSLDFSWH